MLHRSSPPGLAPRPRSERYQPLLVHLSCCFAKLQSESTDRSRSPQFQEGSTCKPYVSGWPDLCKLRQAADSDWPFKWLRSPVSRRARWLLARNPLESFAISAPERKYSADQALKRITEESFHSTRLTTFAAASRRSRSKPQVHARDDVDPCRIASTRTTARAANHCAFLRRGTNFK